MKVFEMFSGFGGTSFALKKAGIPFECVGYAEVDKYAIQCYEQNHKGKNYGDCTKINPNDLPYFDLLTGGFPCQAFSVAGKNLGELDPRGTLFYDIIRIAEVKKPKYILLENVKGLTFKKHKPTFEKILSELKRIGYDVVWKVLNTKNHGIPQNRERVFFVCKLGKWGFNEFQFPQEEELKIFIKDILEEEVDEKYYLSELIQERFRKYLQEKDNKNEMKWYGRNIKTGKNNNNPLQEAHRVYDTEGIITTVKTKPPNIYDEKYIVAMRGRNPQNPKSRKVGLPTVQMLEKREDGCSNTLSTVQKDNLVYDSHRKGEIREYKNISYTLSQAMGTGGNNIPMVLNNPIKNFKEDGDISVCLTATSYKGYGNDGINIINQGNLRRLTPKECFRLQGFLNDEIELSNLSDTQKYKLAGNGWDVNLVSKIFKQMFKTT